MFGPPELVLTNDKPLRMLRITRKSPTFSLGHFGKQVRNATSTWNLGFLCKMLLVGRYGLSIYGAIVYSTKSVELLLKLDFGIKMISCTVAGFTCAVYCAYSNGDLCTLLELTLARVSDAVDANGSMWCLFAILAALFEFVRTVFAHTLQVGNYRIWSELQTALSFMFFLHRALRSFARGEIKTLTGSMLQWIESQTSFLHQLRCMWHSIAEVATDVIHEASNMVQHVAQSLADHIAGYYRRLALWAVKHEALGAITQSRGLKNPAIYGGT